MIIFHRVAHEEPMKPGGGGEDRRFMAKNGELFRLQRRYISRPTAQLMSLSETRTRCLDSGYTFHLVENALKLLESVLAQL